MVSRYIDRCSKKITMIRLIDKSYVLQMRIWITYARLMLGNRFISPKKAGVINLFGYDFEYPNRGSLHGMFKEIFIKKNYNIAYTEDPIIIFDCGSNIGMSLLYFRLRAPNAKIIAFEPNPHTYAILTRNVTRNKLSVELHNIALGSSEGTMTLYTDTNDKSSQGASLTRHLYSKKRTLEEVTVTVKKLSTFVTSEVDVLKLDIEGAEGDVLEDLRDTQTLSHVDICFIEYHHDGEHTSYSLGSLLTILESFNMVHIIESAFKFPFDITLYPKYYSYKITSWRKRV